MLLEPAIAMMERLEQELKDADPQKRERFIELALSLVELSTKSILQNSRN